MKKNDVQKKYVRLQYTDNNVDGYIYCYVRVDDIYRVITSKRGATQVILKDQKTLYVKDDEKLFDELFNCK